MQEQHHRHHSNMQEQKIIYLSQNLNGIESQACTVRNEIDQVRHELDQVRNELDRVRDDLERV